MTFGDVIQSFASPDVEPVGVGWDGKYLYIVSNGGNVNMMDRKGNTIKTLSTPVPTPRGIVLVGNRWFECEGVSASSAIWILDREFNEIREMAVASTTSINLQGIAFDGRYLYATEGGGSGQVDIHVFSLDGTQIREITPPGAGQGTGVEIIGERIFFLEVTNDLIRVLDMNGEQIRSVAAPAGSTRDLAFDGKYLWTCDFVTDLVYQLSLQ